MVVLPAELNCKRTKILDLFYLFELIFLNYVLYYSLLSVICQVKINKEDQLNPRTQQDWE